MSSISVPRSVGEIDGFIFMLRAACEDRAMNERLDRLLSLPDERRQALVHTWVNDLIIARAPRPMIEAVACLSDTRVAEKAYEVIYPCGVALAPESQQRARSAAWHGAGSAIAVVLMLGGGFLSIQFAAGLAQELRGGLPAPPGLEMMFRLAPGVTAFVAAVAAAAWLHAGRPHRWLPWAGAMLGAVAALSAIAFGFIVTQVPINGCAQAEAAVGIRPLDAVLREANACLGFSTLQPQGRASTLSLRSWAHARQGKFAAALADIEASQKLRPATTPAERLLYARRLGQAGKWEESLAVVGAVERSGEAVPAEVLRTHRVWAERGMAQAARLQPALRPAGSSAPAPSSNSR